MIYLNKYKIHSTRYPLLGYTKIDHGCWMFLDLSDGRVAQVGAQYKTSEAIEIKEEEKQNANKKPNKIQKP